MRRVRESWVQLVRRCEPSALTQGPYADQRKALGCLRHVGREGSAALVLSPRGPWEVCGDLEAMLSFCIAITNFPST